MDSSVGGETMNIIDNGKLRILYPSFGYVLYNKSTDSYSEKIYLGKYANVDDYEEVLCEPKTELILQVNEDNKIQDTIIDISMMALDELYYMLEPVLMSVVTTTANIEKKVVNPMVELYVVMVQRGLKTLDEVPARYRKQVEEILNAVEK